MSQHLLIERAFRFPPPEAPETPGWRYRRDIGAWADAADAERLYVDPPNPNEPSKPGEQPKPKPISKKMDHETGEDMKGA